MTTIMIDFLKIFILNNIERVTDKTQVVRKICFQKGYDVS